LPRAEAQPFHRRTDYRHLKEHEAGTPVSELCRKHGVSDASINKWKAKFGGMDVSEAKRLKTLKDENSMPIPMKPPLWRPRIPG